MSAPLARCAAPGDLAVCIHDPPGQDEALLLHAIQSRGLRLWYAWGVDPMARLPLAKAERITEQRAKLAFERGAEVVELNGEVGWKGEPTREFVSLAERARVLISAVRATGARVGWTSFDHLFWHRLPWREIAGAGGVDLFSPQYYAADPGLHRLRQCAPRARVSSITRFMSRSLGPAHHPRNC